VTHVSLSVKNQVFAKHVVLLNSQNVNGSLGTINSFLENVNRLFFPSLGKKFFFPPKKLFSNAIHK
jgi:hypothetical protein